MQQRFFGRSIFNLTWLHKDFFPTKDQSEYNFSILLETLENYFVPFQMAISKELSTIGVWRWNLSEELPVFLQSFTPLGLWIMQRWKSTEYKHRGWRSKLFYTVFANVVFLKKLPHWDYEEGSPIRTARVILPTFLTKKKNNP